ncbi:MAG: hypothetical protein II189_04775 [Lachnospiraceae bacterium]|nr:hypothetical protein [Lachnospiraceae bacterium]
MLPVTLHCDKLYKGNLDFEYAQTAIPFERGYMKTADLSRLELSDGERSYPLQALPTAFWPDGSIRFLLVRFLGFFPGNKRKVIVLDYKGARLPLPAGKVPVLSVSKDEKGFDISTGPLQVRLENGTETVFASLTAEGRNYTGDQFKGPVLVFEGRELLPFIDRWEVVEEGPVMAILEGQGTYRKVFGEEPTRFPIEWLFP